MSVIFRRVEGFNTIKYKLFPSERVTVGSIPIEVGGVLRARMRPQLHPLTDRMGHQAMTMWCL